MYYIISVTDNVVGWISGLVAIIFVTVFVGHKPNIWKNLNV